MARRGDSSTPEVRRRPLIIGHRGFSARFPDNSVEGVQAALEAGADGVEVDVRPSAEGVWVCHHDRSQAGQAVSSMKLAELRAVRVPTLAAVVELLPASSRLFVEVKPLAMEALQRGVEPLLRLLEPRLATTTILSSSPAVLALVGALLPRFPRSWVVTRVPPLIPPGLELSPHHRLVERLATSAVPLNPWTVNDRERIAHMAALGVASITTNHPDRAVEVLGG